MVAASYPQCICISRETEKEREWVREKDIEWCECSSYLKYNIGIDKRPTPSASNVCVWGKRFSLWEVYVREQP